MIKELAREIAREMMDNLIAAQNEECRKLVEDDGFDPKDCMMHQLESPGDLTLFLFTAKVDGLVTPRSGFAFSITDEPIRHMTKKEIDDVWDFFEKNHNQSS